MTTDTEAAIWSRIIEPDKPRMPAGVARVVLQWEFSESDRQRMRELLEKAKAGKLTRPEKDEADRYERVGCFLSTLKSKARLSLKSRNDDS